ncbi:MAG: DUF4430 domain-containing protein [Acutalibacteraceae bacterium]
MKKLSALILSLLLMFSLSACNISSSVVTKKDTVNIDETGIVKSEVIKSLKDENAIQVFKGNCGEIKFEWTLFGSKIIEVRDVNLSAQIKETADSVTVVFSDEETFDFKPMLSVYLNTKWKALNAEVYVNGKKIGTAELTGTDKTVINFTVGEALGEYTVKPIETDSASVTNNAVESEITEENSNTDNLSSGTTTENNSSSNPADVSGGTAKPDNNSSASSSTTNPDNNSSSAKPNSSSSVSSSDRELSSGNSSGQDQYLTDPVPEGKPLPVEPEDAEIDKTVQYTCYFSIECSTIFNNLSELDPAKLGELPSDGIILKKQKVVFYAGESVFDVLKRVCKENGIQMESSFTPMYNSAYVEGINNLYEFDCGNLSGWMYRVDGWYPNYGCSRYQLCDGETVEWRYTCDLGKDVGCEWLG